MSLAYEDDAYMTCEHCGGRTYMGDRYCSHCGELPCHTFGAWESARFTGNPHRKCQTPGCRVVSLDGDDG